MIMAEKKREKDPSSSSSSSSSSSMSVSDALLFTTMCMVGLPVEVQVKDGSLYSGIFHTASLDNGYGVILKKARKIGKGRHETSFTIGSLIDTLVVSSDDLVQIAVKDILLPVERFVGNLAGGGMEAATGKIESRDCMLDSERDPKPLTSGNNSPMGILDLNKERMSIYGPTTKNTWIEEPAVRKVLPSHLENKQEAGDTRDPIGKIVEKSVSQIVLLQERQVGKDMPQGEANFCNHINEASETKKVDQEDHCLSSNDVCPTQADYAGDSHGALTSNSHGTRFCTTTPPPVKQEDNLDSMCLTYTNIPSSQVQTSTVSSSSTLVSNSKTSSCPTPSESSNVRIYKKNSCVTGAKEFKLNPGAKVFSPSPPNSRPSSTALPTITSAGYISNIPSVLPIALAESGVEISSFATRASVPTKMIHYNSLVNGPTGAPAQYARHVVGHAAAQQQPIRFSGHYHSLQAGPTYLHPSSPQVMVGRTSQVVYVHPTAQDAFQGASVFPQGSPYPLLNPCEANMPKFQGAGGFQTFVAPSNVPIPQPFSTIRTTLVPGGNGFFASKFP